MSDKRIYSIPARFRRVENLHILFWLIKDACWALNYKPLGMFMIIPTFGVALMITWQTRKVLSELMHNLAVVFWIFANCLWMIGEFYHLDEGPLGFRRLALIPFALGLITLAVYYFVLLPNRKIKERMDEQVDEAVEEELRNP